MSKSRVAQEQLVLLEKQAAPFDDQLVEASRFIGVDLDVPRASEPNELERDGRLNAAAYHGREEWLLRWLLKRLQAPKDEVPRY